MQRRCLTFTGVKPRGLVRYRCEKFSVYGAGEPTTGARLFLEWPPLNATTFQLFLEECAHPDRETLNMVLMDHGSGQTAQSLERPENLGCLFLPPDSPERNPIERRWPEVNAPLAGVMAAALDELAHQIDHIITRYSKAAIHTLTSSPFLCKQ
jgi:hypothetical protein